METIIFKTYTGNAMLNNALMTIEALAGLKSVNQITPKVLLSLYEKYDLKSLSKRMKSYTMLFTKNGPLHNDAKNGLKIYDGLMISIFDNVEIEGNYKCEVSGLKFNTTFESHFTGVLKNIGLNEKEIAKKDTRLNRNWFPLIGGLGSDAHALPQAKFTIQIHPICVTIMQFLPLSALLYKRGILLVDSSNFEFARSFIKENVKNVIGRIETTPSNRPIESIRDYAKGHFLLRAIRILEDKEMEDEHSDLNLWSFSNSGTGASCEIERVPNSLIKKLIRLKQDTRISGELKWILANSDRAYWFLECLEENREWLGLYPYVSGSGKRKVEFDGVSVEFIEAYFKEIDSTQKIQYAKYLAGLIDKYKTDAFDKYLGKREAYKEPGFKEDLFVVLIKATERGEWDLRHHLQILDDAEQVPIRNSFYKILKITHFYYYKKVFASKLPTLDNNKSNAEKVCEWLIAYIQQDTRRESIVKDLLSSQKYLATNYTNIFYRASEKDVLDFESIYYALFGNSYRSFRIGLNGLLRIFFSQPIQEIFPIKALEKPESWELTGSTNSWLKKVRGFAEDYQTYYFNKYEDRETGDKPIDKFLGLVKSIPNENSKFLIWFYEAIENINEFLKTSTDDNNISDKWSDALLYSPDGEYALLVAKFSIKFTLLKQCHHFNELYINN
ncbi:hypothetical protein [Roseivirga sp. UBA838]|uniref:hypothetical protein n=1 Tax=Roseivirga sp. UBA838 TaxID=1947393 RepID=UPI002580066F|nr:hypothetical protein [Roseivirga sp. UBA838]|tara:strand:- start:9819 stop:11828 length:2010 start_codon:yes stop_codon:yes gene_type:complete